MDLCIRYEILNSWGRRPSERFLKALAARVEQMGQEEDTLYIKNGQPVKAPAIDLDAIAPRSLDIGEADADYFGAKGLGQNRFQNAGMDSAADVVTERGLGQFWALAKGAVKANELTYSTQANSGDEWVPTLMNAQLWRTIRLEAAVLNLFTQFDMPSQPYDYPIESTDPVFYMVGETTNEAQLILTGGPFTDSKLGTGKVTFSAGKLGAINMGSSLPTYLMRSSSAVTKRPAQAISPMTAHPLPPRPIS
jgi:hypothetical protein